jgi:hypothetical protein
VRSTHKREFAELFCFKTKGMLNVSASPRRAWALFFARDRALPGVAEAEPLAAVRITALVLDIERYRRAAHRR